MNSSSPFPVIMKRGFLVHSPHLSLKALKGDHFVSVVVSKKVAKTAVDRNRLKRRVRAITQLLQLQGIFFTKKGAATLPFSSLKQEVEELIEKAVA